MPQKSANPAPDAPTKGAHVTITARIGGLRIPLRGIFIEETGDKVLLQITPDLTVPVDKALIVAIKPWEPAS
ncbi:MAG: hypothetical protein ACRD4R_08600 [Candidatus Acidiferrales bacterium]